MQQIQRRFGSRNRQLGQGMTEYIIITALIAIAAIAAVSYFGGTVRSQIGGMAQELSGTTASSAIGNAKTNAKAAEKEGKDKQGMSNYTNDDVNQ